MEKWMINRDNICRASCDGCNADIGTNTCTFYELSQFWANEAQRKLLEAESTMCMREWAKLTGEEIYDNLQLMLKQLETKWQPNTPSL
jgi:hypothetical protein